MSRFSFCWLNQFPIPVIPFLAKSKANGSEQAEEDGELLKDEEENKVQEDE